MDEFKYGDAVFHPGDYIIYQNGDSYELGRIKSLRPDGAFVAYHSGETGAKTPYDVMHLLRNAYTIEALDKAGYSVLQAKDICNGKVLMDDYKKFVAVFPASELPRAGGGARCMTMPIWRDEC